MTPETKATMERLGKMTWVIVLTEQGTLGVVNRDGTHPRSFGELNVFTAKKLGLTPGMTIQILPVAKEGSDGQDM